MAPLRRSARGAAASAAAEPANAEAKPSAKTRKAPTKKEAAKKAPVKKPAAKKAPAKKVPAMSACTYLELSDNTSNKFWEITVDGASTTARYGKIGANGASQLKDHDDDDAAEAFAQKQIAAKMKKGYSNAQAEPVKKAAAKKPSAKQSAASRKRKAAPVDDDDDDDEEQVAPTKTKAKAKAAPKKAKSAPTNAPANNVTLSTGTIPVDYIYAASVNSNMQVHTDYGVMLNQTNLGSNNNKFYVIQLLEAGPGGHYHVYNRWGRVGEPGVDNSAKCQSPIYDLDAAKKEFEKKFRDKTKNQWKDRADFVKHDKKYHLIQMDYEDKEEKEANEIATQGRAAKRAKVKQEPCTLDKDTQSFIECIFNSDTLSVAMQTLKIDTTRMPLGALSPVQIDRGMDALEAIKNAVDASKSHSVLSQLSSDFYTLIPHASARHITLPTIGTLEAVQGKFDLMNALSNICAANDMSNDADDSEDLAAHPTDLRYKALNGDLELVDKKSEEFKKIERYTKNTCSSGNYGRNSGPLVNIWKLDRKGEEARFEPHRAKGNLKLLWHGTNVGVVAAVVRDGLRIMPHSGGRVGRGIYLASEQSKSRGYTSGTSWKKKPLSVMFLVEAALGKEHHIKKDDFTLRTAPAGYHSIVAKGSSEPDPKNDTTIEIDGKEVCVPQSKPVAVPKFSDSYFDQSEYLLYKEEQHRIRYVLQFAM